MPRTVCRCQPMAMAISSIVAPSGRCNRPMTWACFDPAREPDAPGAVGPVATGKFPNAAQRRRAAVLRSLNLDNVLAPGKRAPDRHHLFPEWLIHFVVLSAMAALMAITVMH